MVEPDLRKRLTVGEFLKRAWPSQRREAAQAETMKTGEKRKRDVEDEPRLTVGALPQQPQQPLQEVNAPNPSKKAKLAQNQGKENKPDKKALPHRMKLRGRK